MKISEFVLFQKEGSSHYIGYANYFGLESRPCIIRKTKGKFIVLVDDDGWKQIGLFYPQRGKVRGTKEYELVGLIWTPEHTFHVVKDGNRFLGL